MKELDQLELRTTIVEAIYEWQHPVTCEKCYKLVLPNHLFKIKQVIVYDQTDSQSLVMHLNCENPTFAAHNVTGEWNERADGFKQKLELPQPIPKIRQEEPWLKPANPVYVER